LKKFIHQSTRLNASIYKSFNSFTKSQKLNIWLCDISDLDNEKYEFKIKNKDLHIDTLGSKIIEKKVNRKLEINLIEKNKKVDSIVEINFMKCAPLTDYCTEIHLLHKKLDEKDRHFFNRFWKNALDTLRYFYNEEWIIQDKDLNRSKLTGRNV